MKTKDKLSLSDAILGRLNQPGDDLGETRRPGTERGDTRRHRIDETPACEFVGSPYFKDKTPMMLRSTIALSLRRYAT